MWFMPNFDRTIGVSQQKLGFIRSRNVLPILVNCSLSFLFLVATSGTQCVLVVLLPLCFKGNVFCIHRCPSAYFGCMKLPELLLASALISLAILLWPLLSTKNCCSLNNTGCFHFFRLLCKNPGNIYVWKSHLISSFWNTHASSSGTKNHAMFKVTQITFFPVLMLRLNLSQLPSPCLGVWMHWVTAIWLADLDVCVNEQMNRCTCSSVVLCNLNI